MMMAKIKEEGFNKQAVLAGLDLKQDQYDILNLLIVNENDFVDFWTIFNNKENSGIKKNIGFAVSQYRQHVIDNTEMEFEEFHKMILKGDAAQALEMMFCHRVLENDLVFVNKWMDRGNTWVDLYNAHKEKPYLTMFKIIL